METTISRVSGYVLVPNLDEDVPARLALPREIIFEHWDGQVHLKGIIDFFDDRYRIIHLEVDVQGDRSRPDKQAWRGAVTHEVLRSIALSQLVIDAVKRSEPSISFQEGDVMRTKDSHTLTIDERAFLIFHLARVAGENTNAAIAAELGISSSAAAQRVARLRKKGWLPPARKQGARR